MLLGRDFLARHNVTVSHGSNIVTIGNIRLQVNTLDASTSPLPQLTSSTIEANQNHIFDQLASLRNVVAMLKNTSILPDTLSTTITATDLQLSVSSSSFTDAKSVVPSSPDATVTTADLISCNSIDALGVSSTETIIEPRSQRLVRFASNARFDCSTIMLEPTLTQSSSFVVARSIHSPSSPQLYCSILNPSDEQLTISANTHLGRLSEAEEANIKFDQDVVSFVTLDVDEHKRRVASSLPLAESKPDVFERLSSLRISDQLDHEQRAQLQHLISQRLSAFQWDGDKNGQTRLVQHYIPTGDHAPIAQRQYPIPQIAQEPLNKQVNNMLETKVIRPSNSPWRSPVLLVKQKNADGTAKYRFCIDLKRVNAVTTKDSYSLPLIHRSVDVLSGARYFSTFDVDRAFWQVGLAEEDKTKTAFVVNSRLYEFNVMPFGSMNAPSTFQRLLDRVLHGLTWRQCLVYIDDVLIFSRTFDEHLRHIDEVLARFQFAGLKLKPSKCMFANAEVDYLGFRITQHGITATAEKIKAVSSLLPPTTNKQLYSFLCSINYYRSLIPNFGELTYSLYEMVRTGLKSCEWSTKQLKCFEALKRALVTAPILAYPDFDKQFIVHSDASDYAIAAVLLQRHDKLLKPVSFASRRLIEAETRYTVSERELLAIIYAYQRFYAYVYGRPIIFYTDHMSLVTARRLRYPNVEEKRLVRLFHQLQDVDYELRFIPGSENYLADFLSRAFDTSVAVALANNIHLQSSIDWLVEQSKDAEITSIVHLLNIDSPDIKWLELNSGRRWLSERHNLHISHTGILLHSKNRIVCPSHMFDHIMFLFHDSPFAGHRAFETTLEAVKVRYYWHNMSSIVKQYCQSCVKCQRFNFSCLHPRAPLHPIEVSRPWQLVGVDFMGPFRESQRGNKYIILAIDHLTKFAEGAATVSFDALTTAQFLFDTIVCRHGMFEKLLSDQGVNFESHLLKQLCILLGTDKLHTSTYHAAGNGITERLNKTIKPALAKLVNDDHDDWDAFLPMALSAYNNSLHSTTQLSPYEALYHRPSVQVSDVLLANQLPFGTAPHTISDFILDVRRKAEQINETLLKNTQLAQTKQKQQYDRFVRDKVSFTEGDMVKITNFRVRPEHSKRFEPKFIGPYCVARQHSNLKYALDSALLPAEHVHYNRMEKCHMRRAVIARDPSVPVIVQLSPIDDTSDTNSDTSRIVEYNPRIILRRSPRISAVVNLRADRAASALVSAAASHDYALDDSLVAVDAEVEVLDRPTASDIIISTSPLSMPPALEAPPLVANDVFADADEEDVVGAINTLDDSTVTIAFDGTLMKYGVPGVRFLRCKRVFEATRGIKIHKSINKRMKRRSSIYLSYSIIRFFRKQIRFSK